MIITRKLYNLVNNIINDLDLNEIWTGFSKSNFALYDKNYVYFKNNAIPYDNRFLGNTRINYEGEELAIWFIDKIEDIDYKELAANIIHEMFHVYQISQKESRFPDDIKALSYPNNLDNYKLKYNENIMIVDALNSNEISVKEELLMKIIASRQFRLNKYGSLINYEFVIETIEGAAEYCGTKALKLISEDLYNKRIANYKEILASDKKMLFDIRRCSYFTGILFLLLLDEIGINFSKEITGQEFTIFEQLSLKIDTNNIVINKTNADHIQMYFKDELSRKNNLIDNFYKQNPIIHNGEFSINGYDPMNMFKINDKVYCNHFIILLNMKTNESIFVPGPTIIILEDDNRVIKSYYTLK